MGGTGSPSDIHEAIPRLASQRSGDGPRAGGDLEVREVASRRDLNRFVKLPWKLHADDPQWVPPLLVDVKEFLNRKKHPFYLHGEATQFLALRSGVPVGRILVSDDPHYNSQHEENLGCFGMFECIDDTATAGRLLDAAAEWLRARGRATIRGPVDYSLNYGCGLLIDGFDTPPRVMMNHNPPYYAALLESWGLAKVKDLYCWWFDDRIDMIGKWRRQAERLAKRGGVTIRSFRIDQLEAETQRCLDVYNGANNDLWGFVGLSPAEFRYLAKRIARLAAPDLVLIAEVNGKPVGFSVTLPDLNEAIRPLNGRLTTFGIPIGAARLMRRLRRVKTARMLVLDLLADYRGRGISELLILRTLDLGKNKVGYETAELGWTLEDNHLSNRIIEAVGAKRYKTYRIFEKSLT